MTEQVRKAMDVKRKHEELWMGVEGVVAIGVGMVEGQAGIIVSVKESPEIIRRQIPSSVEGVKVVIHQTGEIKAQ